MSTDLVELAERSRQQAVVARLARDALSAETLHDVLQDAAQLAAETLGVEMGSVLELNADGTTLLLAATHGWPDHLVGATMSVGESHSGVALTSLGPVGVEDLLREERFTSRLLPAEGALSGVAVPIAGVETPFGVLCVHSLVARAFRPHDVGFLEALANVIAEAAKRADADARHRRTQSALEQSARLDALGQLAGGIAHDLNNLLAVIMNYATFIEGSLAKPEPDLKQSTTDAAEIRKAAVQAAALMQQLLAFGRRESVAMANFDVNAVASAAVELFGRTLAPNIKVELDLAKHEIIVNANQVQLAQVLLNMGINARDAMPAGGTITVTTDVVSVGGGGIAEPSARIRICDEGEGIAPEIIDRVFDPFFTTKPRGKGTGIGLAVAYGFVHQSGGSIGVESEVGNGTEFTLLLPLIVPEALDAPMGIASARARILVVDDEPALRQLTRRMLEGNDIDTATASSRDEALEILQAQGPFDAVVTDIVMPGGSGMELATAVRRAFPGTRVIFMSGYTGDLADASMDGLQVVHKPFTEAELLSAVRGALSRG